VVGDDADGFPERAGEAGGYGEELDVVKVSDAAGLAVAAKEAVDGDGGSRAGIERGFDFLPIRGAGDGGGFVGGEVDIEQPAEPGVDIS